jgi:hypothetical protein
VVEQVEISYGLCQAILTEGLGMMHVIVMFISQLLTWAQKENHVSVASDLHECVEPDETLLKSIMTGGESWVYVYGPKTKQ